MEYTDEPLKLVKTRVRIAAPITSRPINKPTLPFFFFGARAGSGRAAARVDRVDGSSCQLEFLIEVTHRAESLASGSAPVHPRASLAESFGLTGNRQKLARRDARA